MIAISLFVFLISPSPSPSRPREFLNARDEKYNTGHRNIVDNEERKITFAFTRLSCTSKIERDGVNCSRRNTHMSSYSDSLHKYFTFLEKLERAVYVGTDRNMCLIKIDLYTIRGRSPESSN